MLELVLPDELYRTVTRSDLRDVRVFNADGAPVPHAFCAASGSEAPQIATHTLPVFELREAQRGGAEGTRIEVQTGGARVSVQESTSTGEPASGRTHIIDASGVEEPLRAIQFDWASPDEASQAVVRIEASPDLDRWSVVVAASTLLRASQGGQELRRERIELPVRAYEYLRVQRVDRGPPLIIRAVDAESVVPVADVEPEWFEPDALGLAEPSELLFDASRLAPVQYARLRLPHDNSSMNVTLESRSDDKAPWRTRWSGEAWTVVTDAQRRESPPALFRPTADRYWRVLLPKEAEGSPPPTLELGYRPQRLRFLAQGPAPYTLAFGSRRAEPADPAPCDDLLANVGVRDREELTALAYATEFRTLGGEAAFKPLPRQTPVRTIVLWGVLILGVGLLAGMALSLLRRVRADLRAEDGDG